MITSECMITAECMITGGGGGAVNRVVDAHHHVWDLAVRDQDWITGAQMTPIRRSFSLDDLRTPAAAAGVTATVVVQTVAVPEETPDLLDLAASDDLVAGVVGWVDLTAATVADDLAALQQGPGGQYLTGIRHLVQGETDPGWLRRPEVRRGLAAVGAAGLRYDLLTLPHQLPAAADAAAALEEVEFVLDHCAKPPIASGVLEPWATSLRALARLPNVSCKLSGLATEAAPDDGGAGALRPYVEVVLDAFGPGRMMFGSDWPVCLLATTYAGWMDTVGELTGALSPAERAAIMAGTAERVYRLE